MSLLKKGLVFFIKSEGANVGTQISKINSIQNLFGKGEICILIGFRVKTVVLWIFSKLFMTCSGNFEALVLAK